MMKVRPQRKLLDRLLSMTIIPVQRSRSESSTRHPYQSSTVTDVNRTSTRSLSGSFLEEHYENGRRYCNETYYMPNDDAEQTRLAIAHQVYLPILDGQLTLARVPQSARRILDVGTGTGDWAMAMAERFNNASIIATDITSVFQPGSGPPNVEFELDDAEEEWTYNEAFDFIHMRDMAGAFIDWSLIYAEVYKQLKIGGSFEIADRGMIQLKNEPPNSYVKVFNGALQSAADKAGRPVGLEHLKKPMLERAGLSVTKTKTLEVPLGIYPTDPVRKVAGKMAMIAALEGLEAASLRLLTRHLAWKEEDVRNLCEKVQEEVLNPNAQAFIPLQFVVARKLM